MKNNNMHRNNRSAGVGGDAWRRLSRDKIAMISLCVIGIYVIVALLVQFSVICRSYDVTVGASYEAPSWQHLFGTDIFGRDVATRVLYGTKISFTVGLLVVFIAIPIGVLLGALAGFFGGFVDDIIVWLYQTVASIPGILLILGLTWALSGKTVFGMELSNLQIVYLSIGLTSWVGLCRIIRGEVMKHRQLEYVQAARAFGVRAFGQIVRHILPNISYIILIYGSLIFVGAVMAEVIVTFLGLGVEDLPSWGRMIDDAKIEFTGRGVWWQLTFAGLFLFILVLAINVFVDAFRDALDPRLKGELK